MPQRIINRLDFCKLCPLISRSLVFYTISLCSSLILPLGFVSVSCFVCLSFLLHLFRECNQLLCNYYLRHDRDELNLMRVTIACDDNGRVPSACIHTPSPYPPDCATSVSPLNTFSCQCYNLWLNHRVLLSNHMAKRATYKVGRSALCLGV